MKYYKNMLEKGCFTWQDVCEMVGNKNSASNLIQNYLKKGYIQSIKRNLYTALDLVNGHSTVNKFQIADSITDSAYIFGFSALEYYGYANQVTYNMYIASDRRFSDFEYGGITYKYIKSPFRMGIISSDGVTITDLERSILDCINSFEKYGGIEELLHCTELIPSLNEDRLLQYLSEYNKSVLYQKTGFILEHFRNELYLSNNFFKECRSKIGKSTRYLYKKEEIDQPKFFRKWQIIAPAELLDMTYQGGFEDAEI